MVEEFHGTAPFLPEIASPSAARPAPADATPSLNDGFEALGDSNTSIPPDTTGAVGPSHLVTMLNTEVRIQTRAGGIISTVPLSTFWTSGTGLSGSPFDPKIRYDAGTGRWIATVDADARSAASAVWFAMSASSDPTGSWSFFAFIADGSGTTWADFPGFGFNSTWIAITNNMFSVAADTLVGVTMWVIDKSTALAGGPLTVTTFPTSFSGFTFALKPAVTFGPPRARRNSPSRSRGSGTRLCRVSSGIR